MCSVGFTLIELLAVIVILAIIALITTPLVVGVIEKAKRGALEDSAYGIVDSARVYLLTNLTDQNKFEGKTFDFSGNTDELPISGKRPTKGILTLTNTGMVSLWFEDDGYCIIKDDLMEKASSYKGVCHQKDFSFLAEPQEYIIPSDGKYLIQLWGAEGGTGSWGEYQPVAGKGAYTRGTISLHEGEKLYFYTGEMPTYTRGNCYHENPNNAFNGTIIGSCTGGGGATDVRLVRSDTWSDFNSLKTRIMVAAGGGGAYYTGTGGAGGTLKGFDGIGGPSSVPLYKPGKGAGQTSGDQFGIAQCGTSSGGGGYYGGYAGLAANGGGGSSFISGYPGCDAIKEESTKDNIQHTGSPNHYSGKVFEDPILLDGKTEMPSPDGLQTMVGHTGNGYAKIIKIS